jgi:hypothetical protein
VRKLVELGSLSPWRLDELVGGGLHPGYAFPLWHAFLAAVTKLAGVDPAVVVQHESVLARSLCGRRRVRSRDGALRIGVAGRR